MRRRENEGEIERQRMGEREKEAERERERKKEGGERDEEEESERESKREQRRTILAFCFKLVDSENPNFGYKRQNKCKRHKFWVIFVVPSYVSYESLVLARVGLGSMIYTLAFLSHHRSRTLLRGFIQKTEVRLCARDRTTKTDSNRLSSFFFIRSILNVAGVAHYNCDKHR